MKRDHCIAATQAHDAMNRETEIVGLACDYAYSHDLVGNVTKIVETSPSNSALNRTVVNEYDQDQSLDQLNCLR